MNLLPREQHVLVVAHPAEAVMTRLRQVVRPPVGHPGSGKHAAPFAEGQFNGLVGETHFSISRMVLQQQMFLPLLQGRVEGASRSCILFVDYRLFDGAQLLLALSSVLILVVGLFFLFLQPHYVYAAAAFGGLLLNYAVAVANFRRQVLLSRQALERVLQDVDTFYP